MHTPFFKLWKFSVLLNLILRCGTGLNGLASVLMLLPRGFIALQPNPIFLCWSSSAALLQLTDQNFGF